MNSLALVKQNSSAMSMTDDELLEVLESSLYPGAKPASIKMVLGYCRAANLDPMQKPVHIVPMNVKKAGSRDYEWRDVVMPGISLYRTQAARTGQYAGISEVEYGEDVTGKVGGIEITYPKWARVIARRLLPNGQMAEFSAKEFWLENYATAGKDSAAPNSMWKKRPYAQLGKCAEAQALRKAFPEVGAQPTADEMEGKSLDGSYIDHDNTISVRKPSVALPASKSKLTHQPMDVVDTEIKQERQPNDALATVGEVAYITKKIDAAGLSISQARERAGLDVGDTLDGLTKDGFIALKGCL